VHALLDGPDHHVTAEDIASHVQREHPDVHLSTVYRTLDALERLGLVNRLNLGAKGAVYHLADPDHSHHHLVCERCGAVVELSDETVAPLGRELAARHRFTMSPHALTITGRCSSCS
jgi:Fur family ferric uptake transcriptional regulator